jgi:type VI secretion system secreted protein Hcp
MAIFLQYGDIKGDATESEHKEWSVCDGFAFSTSRHVVTHLGKATEREGKEVAITDLTINKPVDAASPYLYQASFGGFGKTAKLNITRTSEDGEIKYLEILLEKACVTAYSLSTEGTNHLESLSLNFMKIGITYTPVLEEGTADAPLPVGFDIAEGKSAPPTAK